MAARRVDEAKRHAEFSGEILTVEASGSTKPYGTTDSSRFALTEPPMFAEPIPNVTVALGRDVSLPCVVENLGNYKELRAELS
ncbi:hypothetical protein KM043_003944 [Ampulex compressa]|nr:hypothetical protein KM043_003944 [Ampulex compressa]